MATKKKITKKKVTKKTRAKATKVANVDLLKKAGVIDPKELGSAEVAAINGQLTGADIKALVGVFRKLGGARKGRVHVQLCF